MTADKRTDTASRIIGASADAIYRAFEKDSIMHWLPPSGMKGTALEYDFREGGSYRIELTYEDETTAGKTTKGSDISKGRFVALEAGRRIEQTVEFESQDAAFAGEMLMTWTFEPVLEGTLVTIVAKDVPAGISKKDHDEGLRSSLANLAAFVETGTPRK